MDGSTILLRLIVIGLYAILPVVFLVRGVRHGPRSRRCANIALGLGLLAFVMPEITLKLVDWERSATFICSGCIRVGLGLLAVVLAVVALSTRRDGGTGVARLVVGLLFALLHLAFGVGLIRVGTAVQVVSTPDTEWNYRSPADGFRVTMPSPEWKEVPPIGGRGEASFFRTYPRMYCSVLTTLRDKSEADFESMTTEFRRGTEGGPPVVRAPRHRNGTNTAGHRYYHFTAVEAGPQGQPLFSAMSLTWCAEKRIVVKVFFEGSVTMSSQAGREAELEAMEAAAERILLSVE